MNGEKQKKQILRYLNGTAGADVDSFCIYQWLDRCCFEGWWEFGLRLGSAIPPNALDEDYSKRVDYLSGLCRDRLSQTYMELREGNAGPSVMVPKTFPYTCANLGLDLKINGADALELNHQGRSLLLLKRVGVNGCVFCFPNADRSFFCRWLEESGLQWLTPGNAPGRVVQKADNVLVGLAWNEANEVIHRLKETVLQAKDRIPDFFSALIDGANPIDGAKVRHGTPPGIYRYLGDGRAEVVTTWEQATDDQTQFDALMRELSRHEAVLEGVFAMWKKWILSRGRIKTGRHSVRFVCRDADEVDRTAFTIEVPRATFDLPKLALYSGDSHRQGYSRGRPGSPLIANAGRSDTEALVDRFGILQPSDGKASGDWKKILSHDIDGVWYSDFVEHALTVCGLSGHIGEAP
jgi:hypothetical protein